MSWIKSINNPYGDDKVMAACGLFGVLDTSGGLLPARQAVTAIANMHDRNNGLGGGFAAYGLYPEHADCFAFHVMYMREGARDETEAILEERFTLVHHEEIPTRPNRRIGEAPALWRYFLRVDPAHDGRGPAEEYVIATVMRINTAVAGAYVFSSGQDMGVFKGVGYPEDIAEFFRLDDYQGYLWVGHGRFPTNTPGWWGGAHPFAILDWTVVHNGEISSYGTNVRYLEMFGYHCTMQTDTEVVAYAIDLLMRRHGLPIEAAASVLSPPFWSHIEREPEGQRALHAALRRVYGELLLNGPFTVIIARRGEMIGLTDRIRLRPLTAATKGDLLYLSSEEAAIRLVCPDLERLWTPMGGEPVVGTLGTRPGAGVPQEEAPRRVQVVTRR